MVSNNLAGRTEKKVKDVKEFPSEKKLEIRLFQFRRLSFKEFDKICQLIKVYRLPCQFYCGQLGFGIQIFDNPYFNQGEKNSLLTIPYRLLPHMHSANGITKKKLIEVLSTELTHTEENLRILKRYGFT
jgi:hypothetical protein